MINTFNSDSIFQKYITHGKTVGYYPSAGFYDKKILSYPFDVIILSDYVDSQSINGNWQGHIFTQPQKIKSAFIKNDLKIREFIEFEVDRDLSYAVFEKNEKIFLYFFEDNNNTVERLVSAHLSLDGLITINDGCREGGNYECINTKKWLYNLESVLQEDTVFVRDHFEDSDSFSIITMRMETPKSEKIKKVFEMLYSDKSPT